MAERVPTARIEAEARQIDLGRLVATVLMAVVYVLGWIVGKAARVLATGLAAAKVGFLDAYRSRPPGPGS